MESTGSVKKIKQGNRRLHLESLLQNQHLWQPGLDLPPYNGQLFRVCVPPYHNDDYTLRSNPLASAVEMSLGICIASLPLVAWAFKQHRSQLSSVAGSLSSPFLRIGRTFTARSTIDHKSTAIYEVNHDSGSNNGFVELGMPMQTRRSM